MVTAKLNTAACLMEKDDYNRLQASMTTFMMRLCREGTIEDHRFYYSCWRARYLITPNNLFTGRLNRVERSAGLLKMETHTFLMLFMEMGPERFNRMVAKRSGLLCHGQKTISADPAWKCLGFEKVLWGVPPAPCQGGCDAVNIVGKRNKTYVLDGLCLCDQCCQSTLRPRVFAGMEVLLEVNPTLRDDPDFMERFHDFKIGHEKALACNNANQANRTANMSQVEYNVFRNRNQQRRNARASNNESTRQGMAKIQERFRESQERQGLPVNNGSDIPRYYGKDFLLRQVLDQVTVSVALLCGDTNVSNRVVFPIYDFALDREEEALAMAGHEYHFPREEDGRRKRHIGEYQRAFRAMKNVVFPSAEGRAKAQQWCLEQDVQHEVKASFRIAEIILFTVPTGNYN